MMEKDQPDSMATVQMTKADYAASEVYSTTSEPPPAYKRETSSVRIAKIVGLTVVVSSVILGAFILASTYLQARASCDQMQTLDSILEKELMLETLQQELPKAEALLSGREVNDNDLQSMDDNKKDVESVTTKTKGGDTESDASASSDNSFSDDDESDELNRVQIKMPMELSLSELAHSILQQNQKSRMNCVIERRRAEELVDGPPKMMQLPFGVALNMEPKKRRVTGERMAIFCESGTGLKNDDDSDEEPRQVNIPVHRVVEIPYGAIPRQTPLTHMPYGAMPQQQQMPPVMPSPPQIPPFLIRQIIAQQQEREQQMQYQQQQQQQQQLQQQQQMHQMQFQQQQQQPPVQPSQSPMLLRQLVPPSENQMPFPRFDQGPAQDQQPQSQQQEPQPPQVGGEIRIRLQRIPIRNELQVREIPIELFQGQPMRPQREQMPQRPSNPFRDAFGLTPDDIMNIQRLAEERIQQELRSLVQDEAAGNDPNSSDNNSEDDDDEDDHDSESEENLMNAINQKRHELEIQQKQQTTEASTDAPKASDNNKSDDSIEPQILQIGRAIFEPVNIPFDKTSRVDSQSSEQQDLKHDVQPRSVQDE